MQRQRGFGDADVGFVRGAGAEQAAPELERLRTPAVVLGHQRDAGGAFGQRDVAGRARGVEVAGGGLVEAAGLQRELARQQRRDRRRGRDRRGAGERGQRRGRREDERASMDRTQNDRHAYPG